LKHAGWTAVRDATGTTWTSPAGQTAHHPRHDQPPVPPPPGARLPAPDLIAQRDRSLVAVLEHHDEPADEEDAPPGLRRTRDASPDPGATLARGWPEDVPF
ncbi:MAG TPA: hypothetical protein VNU66_07080, partial [Mycobacteriales bacterium]|nr:hypothetical protein [Mycobacteriales bacterium]